MKRFLLLTLLAWLALAGPSWSASWDKGWDFRATSGAETDPANSTYAILSDTYPTTRNGVTFGYSSIGGGVGQVSDSDSRSICHRLASTTFI